MIHVDFWEKATPGRVLKNIQSTSVIGGKETEESSVVKEGQMKWEMCVCVCV